jgi:hypothetical protein
MDLMAFSWGHEIYVMWYLFGQGIKAVLTLNEQSVKTYCA